MQLFKHDQPRVYLRQHSWLADLRIFGLGQKSDIFLLPSSHLYFFPLPDEIAVPEKFSQPKV